MVQLWVVVVVGELVLGLDAEMQHEMEGHLGHFLGGLGAAGNGGVLWISQKI